MPLDLLDRAVERQVLPDLLADVQDPVVDARRERERVDQPIAEMGRVRPRPAVEQEILLGPRVPVGEPVDERAEPRRRQRLAVLRAEDADRGAGAPRGIDQRLVDQIAERRSR
jgi:hypothetical protein